MLRETLSYHNPWWAGPTSRLDGLRERSSTSDIGPLFERKEVLAITGVRRCGKSSLMRLLMKKALTGIEPGRVFFVECDDPALTGTSVKELMDAHEEAFPPHGRRFVFLDEVQSCKGWERWLKRYYDAGEDIKFVVSGSNSSLLSSEFSAALTGRQLTYRLEPLSLREALEFKGTVLKGPDQVYLEKARVRNMLCELMRYGGFPEVVLSEDADLKLRLLKEYYGTILTKDVVLRHEVRERDALLRLAYLLLTNIGRPASATSLARTIGHNTKTVQAYMAHLEDAFLLRFVRHFSYSVKEQLDRPVKPYCVDIGLRNAVSFRFSEDQDWLMENLVLLKLAREGDVYYWKDASGEVDFVLYEGLRPVQAVQVCHDLSEAKVREREEGALLRAMGALGLQRGTIVTWDEEGERKEGEKRIELVPMWRWLLG